MSETVHIPQLRFPEFSGEWEEKSVGDVLTIGSGRDYKHLNNGDIPVYGTGGYMTSVDRFLYDGESVCIGRKGTIDKPVLIDGKFWTVDTLFYTHSFIDLLPKFLFPIFKRINWKKYNEASGVPSLSKSTIEKIKLSLPDLPEQQKIAAFLTAVDNKIEQLSKKQELLGEYKKGLMQQIFSQAIRFKADDGSEFPEWEEKRLGDIGEFKTSSVDKKIVEGQKLIQLVNYMNVYKHENISNASTKDLMTVSANETQLNSSNLRKGDILFTPSSETPDDIGHSVVIFEDLRDTLYSYHLMRFRPTIKLDILYSHYFCNISDVLRQVSRVATGSTRFTISVGEFSKILVNLPSLPEQTKIANFLSFIDNKIEQVGKQLDESKQFKKALLQQMFV